MLAAALLFATLLQAQPDSLDYREGTELFRKGQTAAAIGRFSRAVQAQPTNARYWKALGVAYAAQGSYDLASSSFSKACGLDPKLPDACYYLGRAEYRSNRFEAALAGLNKALAVDSRPWRVYTAMGQAQEALGRAAEAERSFQKAIEGCRNTDPSPVVAYGIFLFRQGRTEEAARPLEAVLSRFPESGEANLELGRVYFQLDRLPQAVPLLEKAARLLPDSTAVHVLLSKTYARLGREADAQREAGLALKKHRDSSMQ